MLPNHPLVVRSYQRQGYLDFDDNKTFILNPEKAEREKWYTSEQSNDTWPLYRIEFRYMHKVNGYERVELKVYTLDPIHFFLLFPTSFGPCMMDDNQILYYETGGLDVMFRIRDSISNQTLDGDDDDYKRHASPSPLEVPRDDESEDSGHQETVEIPLLAVTHADLYAADIQRLQLERRAADIMYNGEAIGSSSGMKASEQRRPSIMRNSSMLGCKRVRADRPRKRCRKGKFISDILPHSTHNQQCAKIHS